MKKFKIIEEGRILSPEEQSKINGGMNTTCSTTCTTVRDHASCNLLRYTTCKQALSGFTISDCGGPHITCGSDMRYQFSICAGLGGFTEQCAGGQNYIN